MGLRTDFSVYRSISFKTVALSAVLASSFVLSAPAQAAKKKSDEVPPSESAVATDCSLALKASSSAVLNDFDSLLRKHSVRELFEGDLVTRYPTMLMDAFQTAWYGIQTFGSSQILDPTYRVQPTTLWHAFHDGVSEARGLRIVGHYETVNQYVHLIKKGARGDKAARKLILFVGPAGTGKTEILNIQYYLATRLRNLEMLTFEWKGLEAIPTLQAILKKGSQNATLENQLQRSPLVLFPTTMQDQLVARGAARVRELIDLDPIPFSMADPHTTEVLEALIKHYSAAEWGGGKPTQENYLAMLEKHVNLVPRRIDPNQAPLLVRYQGKEPKFNELFFEENMMRKMMAAPGSALGFDYSGRVPAMDGLIVGWDEYFRQVASLRNATLELIQNQILDFGGAKPLAMNVVQVASSNDESLIEASEDGPTKAQIQRTTTLSMRQSLHPLEIAQTTLMMIGKDVFKMRNLDKADAKEESADLLKVYPLPGADGRLVGSDGRYALTYTVSKNKPSILIAPRAMLLLGLTTAATRLVTDPRAAEQYKAELDIIRQNDQVFADPITRLQVILGEEEVNPAIRLELARAKSLLKEGQNGLQSRDVQRWLADALSAAEANGNTLTPAIIDQTFVKLLDSNGMDYSNAQRTEWLRIHRMIKSKFIQTYLARDLNAILTGDSSRLERLYQEIKREIVARGLNPKAKTYDEPSRETRAINDERLEQIKKIYHELNGRELKYDQLRDYHVVHENADARFVPLVKTIEAFLLKTEMNTATLDSVYDALMRKNTDVQTLRESERVEAGLERLGYNRRAFEEALRFIRETQTVENP